MFLPKRLIFSGGGTRCLAFLPALRTLERQHVLTEVQEWWGTSAGSLLATLLGITRSADRVQEIMHQTNFVRFRDVSLLNMVNFTSAWGLDDGLGMTAEIERILEIAHPGASQWTFADASGIHIVVADLNVYQTVVCSSTTFPTLRLVDAVRASMSLPVFYRPFRCPTNGHIWVDGGLRAAFPWDCLPSKAARDESLGFAFERAWMSGPRTFTEYIFSMLHFEDPQQITALKRDWPRNILWFASPPFPAWYVRLKADDFTLLETLADVAVSGWRMASAGSVGPTPSPSDSGRPRSPPLSEDPSTPPPESPGHRTGELWDIPPPFRGLLRAPFRDSPPHISQSRRRWSL